MLALPIPSCVGEVFGRKGAFVAAIRFALATAAYGFSRNIYEMVTLGGIQSLGGTFMRLAIAVTLGPIVPDRRGPRDGGHTHLAHVLRSSRDRGPTMTLVFIHPVGLDRRTWQFLDQDLLDNSVQYDVLWHGSRPKPDGEFTLAAMADDVVDNVRGQLDLVGLSMGGSIVQHILLQHPDRVRSAAIACSSPGSPGTAQGPEDRARVIDEDGIAALLPSTLERWFTEAFLADQSQPAIQYTIDRLLSDEPASLAGGWRALARYNCLPSFPKIKVPTSVIHASDDKSGSLAVRQAMADALPVGRLDVIPGPHMLHMELPDLFSEAVRRHLAWVDNVHSGDA